MSEEMKFMIIWLVVAAIMVIAEMLSLGLTSIWFAGGAFVTAILAVVGVPFVPQLVCFAVVSLVLLFVMRPLAKDKFMKDIEKTNVDSLIGKQGIVTETIDNLKATGAVKLNGVEWTARSADTSEIEKGQTVVVEKIEGVKAIVRRAGV